jgi:lycopene beta-cyclase
MKVKEFDYIICGGGAAGLLLLNAMKADDFFVAKKILLIEKEVKNSNDRTWSFWETGDGNFNDLLAKEWNHATFISSQKRQDFELTPYRYKMMRSKVFYNKYFPLELVTQNIRILNAEVKEFNSKADHTVVVTDHGVFSAPQVFSSLFDPKKITTQNKYPVLKQHFIGWFVNAPKGSFDPDKILFMDFNIPQKQQTRFLYLLPQNDRQALVEYTLFSKDLLTTKEYEDGIEAYLKSMNITTYQIEEKEQGNIPMSCYPFNRSNTPSLLHIGTAGGWTKASTGFTFMNTVRQINRLIPFLKTERDLTTFHQKSRFWFYDLLFLDVLEKYNDKGSELFIRMFDKNPPVRIFRFLDEKTSFGEELLVLSSFSMKQIGWFLSAFFKRFF